MPSLVDLPNELLERILDFVEPNDLDNFTRSCKILHKLADDSRVEDSSRLLDHMYRKVHLKRIENGWGDFTIFEFPELLGGFLIAPRMADYVKEMAVNPWKVCWDDPIVPDPFNAWEEEDDDELYRPYPDLFVPGPIQPWGEEEEEEEEEDLYRPYPGLMRVFQAAVKDSESIPAEEKEHWISKIKAGDQNPVIALLFPRLHYLTSLVIILDDREDLFMLKALRSIAKNPHSPSLSRLREVEIHGTNAPTHRLELATACAALPSVISLEAHRLVEGPLDSPDSTYEPAPQSSSVRDLKIIGCRFSPNTLFKLIRSAKSLRSLTYTYWCPYDGTHLSFAWVRAALLQFASTSLEELTLRRSHSSPEGERMECSFKSYRNLRVLNIDYGLLMGDKFRTTNKIVTGLPASLEILNLYGCDASGYRPRSKWIPELVNWIIRVKERKIPCLKELNLEDTWNLSCFDPAQIKESCLAAKRAGFEMTVTSDDSMVFGTLRSRGRGARW